MNDNSITKILVYVLVATIIYLSLRYIPQFNYDSKKAAMMATVLFIFIVCVDFLYNYTQPEHMESTPKSCNTCTKPKKSCRVVCDGDEHMTNVAVTQQPSQQPQQPMQTVQPTQQPTQAVQPTQYPTQQPIQMVQPTQQPRNVQLLPQTTQVPIQQVNGSMITEDKYGYGAMFYDEYPYYNRFMESDVDKIQQVKQAERASLDQAETYRKELEANARSTGGYDTAYQKVGARSQYVYSSSDDVISQKRMIKDTLDNELAYSDYNHLPVGVGYKSTDYEYGYNFLPPEKWYPQPVRPPICVTDKRSPVCPLTADGTPTDVKEWNASRRISPPEMVNVRYVDEQLNQGYRSKYASQ